MRAQVPYLARLARYSTGRAALRPPRQLFPGTYSPARRPGTGEAAWPPDSGRPAGPAALPAGRPDGPVPAPQADVLAGPEAVPLSQEGTPSATRPAPAQPPKSWPDQLWGTPVDLPRPAGRPTAPGQTAGETTAPAGAGGRAAPDDRTGRALAAAATPDRQDAPPRNGVPPATRPAAAQPPPSWPGPLQGTPVDLPRPAAAYVPGPTEPRPDRGTVGPGLQPAALAPGPERGRPAGPARGQDHPGSGDRDRRDRGQVSGDGRTRVASGARTITALDRSPAPAAARDLVPAAARDLVPAAAVLRPAAAGTEPAGRPRDPRPSGQPRVSIGTIEVTVLPVAPPAREAGPKQPPAAAVPGRPRPAAPVAAGMTADRLQQGLRRWHGIAQG